MYGAECIDRSAHLIRQLQNYFSETAEQGTTGHMQYFASARINQEYFDTPSTLLIGSFSMFVIFFYIKLLYVLFAIYLSLHYINAHGD